MDNEALKFDAATAIYWRDREIESSRAERDKLKAELAQARVQELEGR